MQYIYNTNMQDAGTNASSQSSIRIIGTGVDLAFLSMPHAHYTYGILQEGGARQAPSG